MKYFATNRNFVDYGNAPLRVAGSLVVNEYADRAIILEIDGDWDRDSRR
jgi:hypothetical protein